MKTKREWIAQAVLLLGSGSILSAAALATTPSPEKTPVPTAAAATIAVHPADVNPHLSTEAIQTAEEESAVQVVTGDLQKNELYIFADNENIPEKVLDENPDATIAVLGANEKKAAEKIELFTKIAKVVAVRREKARIVAAIKAEADYQRLREWNGGHVTLAYDRKLTTDKSALPIQQHLYPHQTQLVNLPAITLSATDAAVVYQEMQRKIEAEQRQGNQQPEGQTLSFNYFDKLVQLEKISLPIYHGVRERAAQFAEMFSAKINAVIAAGQSGIKTEVSHAAAPAPIAVARADVKPIAMATAAVLAHDKFVFPERTLHRYVFRLPKRMQMTAMIGPAPVVSAVKDVGKMAEHPAVNPKSAALVQAAVTSKAQMSASAIHAHVGVVGSAFTGVNVARNSNRLHRPAIKFTDKLNVALLVPSVYSMRMARAVEAPAAKIKLAENIRAFAPAAKTASAAAAVKFAAAVDVKPIVTNKDVSKKITASKSIATIQQAVHQTEAVKIAKSEPAVKQMSRQKYRSKTKSRYVSAGNVSAEVKLQVSHQKPRHHIDMVARERALTAIERQLAAEPVPVFHPHRVATRVIEEPPVAPQATERSRVAEHYPVYHRQIAAATETDEQPPIRRPRHYKVRPSESDVASLSDHESTRATAKRYREWSRPDSFSKMMME